MSYCNLFFKKDTQNKFEWLGMGLWNDEILLGRTRRYCYILCLVIRYDKYI